LRQQLRPDRLDAIAELGEALLHPAHSLLVLREPSIHALEALEHLAANLLQSDHDWFGR
jgi:hypothetical protein